MIKLFFLKTTPTQRDAKTVIVLEDGTKTLRIYVIANVPRTVQLVIFILIVVMEERVRYQIVPLVPDSNKLFALNQDHIVSLSHSRTCFQILDQNDN